MSVNSHNSACYEVSLNTPFTSLRYSCNERLFGTVLDEARIGNSIVLRWLFGFVLGRDIANEYYENY